MNSTKKIIGSIFAVLFVATAVSAVIFFNFDRRAFSAETYQKAFGNSGFYEKIPAVLAQTMVSASMNQNKLPVVMRGMSQEAWEGFFRTLLPQGTLEVMSDNVLNSTFAYLAVIVY